MPRFTSEQADKLDRVSRLAERYAELHKRNSREDKPEVREIVREACALGTVEMAYFCQQVASWLPSTHAICGCLTILANRLLEESEESV